MRSLHTRWAPPPYASTTPPPRSHHATTTLLLADSSPAPCPPCYHLPLTPCLHALPPPCCHLPCLAFGLADARAKLDYVLALPHPDLRACTLVIIDAKATGRVKLGAKVQTAFYSLALKALLQQATFQAARASSSQGGAAGGNGTGSGAAGDGPHGGGTGVIGGAGGDRPSVPSSSPLLSSRPELLPASFAAVWLYGQPEPSPFGLRDLERTLSELMTAVCLPLMLMRQDG